MFSHLDKGQKALFFALCGNFAVLGIVMALFGASLPQIIDSFKWNYLESGAVMAALSVGSVGATFLAGIFLKKMPARVVILVPLALASLGLALFGRSSWWPLNALLMVFVGMGQGFSEVVTNSVVVRLDRPGESRLMNLMHAFFCLGAVAGPLLVALIAWAQLPFALVFVVCGAIQLAAALWAGFQSFPVMTVSQAPEDKTSPAGHPHDREHNPLWLFRQPLFVGFTAMLFLYVGVELAMSNWIAEFFARCRSTPSGSAALMVSVFWAGLLAGRLALSFAYGGRNQFLLLVGLTSASVLCFAGTILMPTAALPVLAAFLTGLCFSGCYPVIMTLAGQEFKGSTTALGICSTAGGLGLLVFPLAIGGLAQGMGLEKAMMVCIVFDACLAGLAALVFWAVRRQVLRHD